MVELGYYVLSLLTWIIRVKILWANLLRPLGLNIYTYIWAHMELDMLRRIYNFVFFIAAIIGLGSVSLKLFITY